MRYVITATMVATMLSNGLPLVAQILPREPINTSPTIYKGPDPIGFRVDNMTPATVLFAWAGAPSPTGFVVLRTTGVGQPWTTLTPTPLPPTAVSFNDQTGVDYRLSYTYRLQANYSSGPPGYIDLPVTLPKPVNPTNVTAKQTGTGGVTIKWYGTGYPVTVFGPGIPGGSAQATGESFNITGLANGQHTWQVATTHQPGNIMTPASEFPSVSVAVSKFEGNYRITLLGFQALNPTDDALLDDDGKADEIMPMVFMRQFDQTSGNPLGVGTVARGKIHGDNQGKWKQMRVQAGTASNTGGIQKGDVFPAGLMQGAIGTLSTTTFPLKVFEGFLTRDREVLVLYPSLWETDDAGLRWFDGYLSGLPPRTRDALNPSTATGAKIRQALDAPGISEIRGDNDFKMDSWGLNATGDRPIGIEAVPAGNGENMGGLFDRVIVLSQRKLEEAVAAPAKYPGMPQGTIGLSFTEGGVIRVTGTPNPTSWNFPANYVLYLRVEAVR